jgi:hypothetical protein
VTGRDVTATTSLNIFMGSFDGLDTVVGTQNGIQSSIALPLICSGLVLDSRGINGEALPHNLAVSQSREGERVFKTFLDR